MFSGHGGTQKGSGGGGGGGGGRGEGGGAGGLARRPTVDFMVRCAPDRRTQISYVTVLHPGN